VRGEYVATLAPGRSRECETLVETHGEKNVAVGRNAGKGDEGRQSGGREGRRPIKRRHRGSAKTGGNREKERKEKRGTEGGSSLMRGK